MIAKEEISERAQRAKEKKAVLGEDVDIEQFTTETQEHEALSSLEAISEDYKQDMLEAGIDPSEKERSGSFLQQDRSVVFSKVKYPGLELMSTTDALKKYEWLKDYSFSGSIMG